MMPKIRPRKAIVAASLAAFAALPAWCAPYDDAVKQYSAGHYKQTLALFNHAAAANPGDPMVHYYLANVLVHMDEHQDAIEEYKLCLSLDPAGPVSDFCLRALKGYNAKPPDASEMKLLRATTGSGTHTAATALSTGGSSAGVAGTKQAQPAVYQPAGRSISNIRRQLAQEKKKTDNAAEASAEDVLSTAQKEVKTIQENTEIAVTRLYATPRLGASARSIQAQQDMAAKEQQIRAQAKEEEEFVLRKARLRADECRLAGEKRGTALDQVADNLEHQLTDDGKYSGVRLVPEGTNLYVRSYAHAATIRPVPETHAAVARIYAQHSSEPTTYSDSAVPGTAQPPITIRSVHGQIVKPQN